MPRLTITNLLALKPRAKRYEVCDSATPGLQLCVRPSGDKRWMYRFCWQGRRLRVVLGKFPEVSHGEAQELVQQARKLVRDGIDPRAAERRGVRPRYTAKSAFVETQETDPHSIATLIDEFMRLHVERRLKNPRPVRAMLEGNVLRFWRHRDARTIRPREVIELLDKVVERGAPVQANHLASTLSQLFRFGVHRAIVEDSPVKLLYRPGGREKPRQRVLSDEELQIFLRDRRAGTRFARLAHVMTLLLLTGQRRGELGNAKWVHLNLREKTWLIPPEHSKNGRGHTVPLSDWALEEFMELRILAGKSPWVLPNASGTGPLDSKLLTRGMAKCQKRFTKLGIAKFTLHDLRRTCRTGLARLRIQPHIAERVLNHVQDRIPATYDVHDYLEEKRDALTKWADRLCRLVRADSVSTPQNTDRTSSFATKSADFKMRIDETLQ